MAGTIATLTLLPGSPAPYQWAVDRTPGWIGAAELAAALNVLLFVPVGIVLAITRRPRLLLLAPVASVTIEAIQWMIPERSPEAVDVLLNSAGSVLGYIATDSLLRLIVMVRRGGSAQARTQPSGTSVTGGAETIVPTAPDGGPNLGEGSPA